MAPSTYMSSAMASSHLLDIELMTSTSCNGFKSLARHRIDDQHIRRGAAYVANVRMARLCPLMPSVVLLMPNSTAIINLSVNLRKRACAHQSLHTVLGRLRERFIVARFHGCFHGEQLRCTSSTVPYLRWRRQKVGSTEGALFHWLMVSFGAYFYFPTTITLPAAPCPQ
jgi:hypothetical protein